MRLKEAQVIEGLYTLEGTPREWGIPTMYPYPPHQWEVERQYMILFPKRMYRFDDFNECLRVIVEEGPVECVDIIDELLQQVTAVEEMQYILGKRITEIDALIKRSWPHGVYSDIGDLIGDFS